LGNHLRIDDRTTLRSATASAKSSRSSTRS
jgi:hypothetical protein